VKVIEISLFSHTKKWIEFIISQKEGSYSFYESKVITMLKIFVKEVKRGIFDFKSMKKTSPPHQNP